MKPSSRKAVVTPAYPWYAKDWLTSEDRLTMTGSERGIYRDLLDHQWVHGSIPKSLNEIITILNLDPEEVTKAWPRVRKKFQILSENRSRLVNFRLETVRNVRSEFLSRATEAGFKSGEVRRRSSRIKELAKVGSDDSPESVEGRFDAPSNGPVELSVSVSDSDIERVQETTSLVGERKNGLSTGAAGDDFVEFRTVAEQYGIRCSDQEWNGARAFVWKRLDFTQKLEAVKGLRDRIEAQDMSLVGATPHNYLQRAMWKRAIRSPTQFRPQQPEPQYEDFTGSARRAQKPQ